MSDALHAERDGLKKERDELGIQCHNTEVRLKEVVVRSQEHLA